jgi:hypothetical protein
MFRISSLFSQKPARISLNECNADVILMVCTIKITKFTRITYVISVKFWRKNRQMNIQLVREVLEYIKSARYAPLSSLPTAGKNKQKVS